MNLGPSMAQHEVFGRTLLELIERHPEVVLLDGDQAGSTGADAVAVARPDRFFPMGVAEQNLIGVAAGLCTVGFAPWVSSLASYLAYRDLDQLRMVVAQPRLNIKLVAHHSSVWTGSGKGSLLPVQDIAILRSMPNMAIVAPADGVETRLAMLAISDYEGPVYLRLAHDPVPTLFGLDHRFVMGRAVTVRDGSDVTLITTGLQTIRAAQAAIILETVGISSLVLHVPTIKPLDEKAIVAAARRTGVVITAEEHSLLGGLGSAVAEVLGEKHPVSLRRVGFPDIFAESGSHDKLLEKLGLTAAHIAEAARQLVHGRAAGKA